MKKLMLAAIAVVAFSGVGMANTVEVKEVAIEKTGAVVTDPCDDCYAYADSFDDGRDRQLKEWTKRLNKCFDDNNCDNARVNLPPTTGPKPDVLTPQKP